MNNLLNNFKRDMLERKLEFYCQINNFLALLCEVPKKSKWKVLNVEKTELTFALESVVLSTENSPSPRKRSCRNGVRSSVSLFERFGGLLIRIRSARAESISLISIDDRRDRESRVSRRGKETGGGEKVEFGRDSSATTLSH